MTPLRMPTPSRIAALNPFAPRTTGQRTALGRFILGRFLLGLGSVFLLTACGPEAPDAPSATPPPPSASTSQPAADPGRPPFEDGTAAAGLDFVHFNGMSGELYYSEHLGGGVALLDYDNDGDLDLYLTQGRMIHPDKTPGEATFPPAEDKPLSDRLYRNDLVPGDPDSLRFTDVTEESGLLGATGYGMGLAVGDVDNNGWLDLYVTNWEGPNQLWRNRGPDANGTVTFEEIGGAAGVDEERWSLATLFFDFDRDGWLDLYVGHYLDYTLAIHKECVNDIGLPEYCGPVSFQAVPDVFFRNLGAGGSTRFEDVTVRAGVTQSPAPVLGAVSGDFDGNGWLDVYLANDEEPNNLLLNQGDGTFVDDALIAGAAMNLEGQAEAGMGIAVGDMDNDGDEDLFIAHLNQETNTLYINDGQGIFDDRTNAKGLGLPSFDYTGFGTAYLDYDNDGRLDLFVVNGAVQGLRDLIIAGDPFPIHQKNLLFHNNGQGFDDVSDRAGSVFELSEVSRGAAVGDVDNDGDTDIVIHNNAGPARLLLNQVGQDAPWLGLRLVGGDPLRDLLGTRVELLAPGPPQFRFVRTEGSYASAHDARVLFGLGTADGAASVRITWPDGSQETRDDLPIGRYTTVRQGAP